MKKSILLLFLTCLTFASGFWVATAKERERTAIIDFMDAMTVLAYVHKGDSKSAIRILHTKADVSLVSAMGHTHWWSVFAGSGVDSRWIAAYADLRRKIRSEEDEWTLPDYEAQNSEFERKLESILNQK